MRQYHKLATELGPLRVSALSGQQQRLPSPRQEREAQEQEQRRANSAHLPRGKSSGLSTYGLKETGLQIQTSIPEGFQIKVLE